MTGKHRMLSADVRDADVQMYRVRVTDDASSTSLDLNVMVMARV